MSPESLPVKLRQLRGTMSLAEAAARARIPEQRIRMYEEGVRQPYTKTLKRLAEAYGVPLSELMVNGGAASTRRAAAAPTVRRRRRRRRAVLQEGERSVEVPVEVSPGERVRIVLELIVRPAATQTTDAPRPTPTIVVPATATVDDVRASPLVTRPQPSAPPTAPRRTLYLAGAGSGSSFSERPRPQGETGDRADGGSSDAHDPLAEFRRAYGEFKRSRRT